MSEQQCRILPALSESDLKRFWSKVDRSNGADACWLWKGTRTTRGYGVFTYANLNLYATRVSWLLNSGEDPYPLVMRHKCHTPPCMNPTHLIPGTQKENMQDSVRDGRMASGDRNGSRTHPERIARGEANGSSKLTDDVVMTIRKRYEAGESCSSIADDYGVAYPVITKIVTGQSWKHVGGPITRVISRNIGERSLGSVLTGEQAAWVLRKREQGWGGKKIAQALGVTEGAVWPIIYGRVWKGVPGERQAPKKRLTAQQRAEILTKRAQGASLMALALEYGKCKSAIHMLCHGDTWKSDTPE